MPSGRGPKTSTTSLPESLREQIDNQNGAAQSNGHPSAGKPRRKQLNRKEARKQDRQAVKARKAAFFSSSRPAATTVAAPAPVHVPIPGANLKRHAPDEAEDGNPAKRKKVRIASEGSERIRAEPAAAGPSSVVKGAISGKSVSDRTEATAESRHVSKQSKTKSKPKSETRLKTGTSLSSRSQVEKDEDAYIESLEAKLGRKGKKSGYLDIDEDGLDDLFTHLEGFESRTFGRKTSHEPSFHDDEDEDEEMDPSFINEIVEDDRDEQEDEESDSEKTEGSDQYDSGSDDFESPEHGEEGDSMDRPDPEPASAYTQPAGRYIPPHLRHTEPSEEDTERNVKLKRQLKGLLNRLSDQNIAGILLEIEGVYRNHRRHDVTSNLSSLIIEGISSHSSLLDSYVVLHAALVAALHKIIGIEFGASFVQDTVSTYEKHFNRLQDLNQHSDAIETQTEGEAAGKECSNLIVLLAELYNFQVISCVLVYDLVRGLLTGPDLHEMDVELLLKVVRTAGVQLRYDDPLALKDIIALVQSKVAEGEQMKRATSSRTRFMVETLINLKNNKLKKGEALGGASDAVDRMKKFLSGVNKKHHVLAHEPLRVSLEDLHSAESKGKWWLVGAAWGGDPLLDRQQKSSAPFTQPGSSTTKEEAATDALLRLARKHGMNTDIRRSIFVVLMSSDDYIDACERLSQLNLTELQQREIIRVALHCCGNEKAYNPYYSLVCAQLCQSSHSHAITLQFCLWDFLRDLGESGVGGAERMKSLQEDGPAASFDLKKISETRIKNVARAYAWWVAKGSCSLTILKPVDFTAVKSQGRKFLHEFFLQLFAASQVSSPAAPLPVASRNRGVLEEVFVQATKIDALAQGLLFFLASRLKKAGADDEDEDEDSEGEQLGGVEGFWKWGLEVGRDTLRIGLDIIT